MRDIVAHHPGSEGGPCPPYKNRRVPEPGRSRCPTSTTAGKTGRATSPSRSRPRGSTRRSAGMRRTHPQPLRRGDAGDRPRVPRRGPAQYLCEGSSPRRCPGSRLPDDAARTSYPRGRREVPRIPPREWPGRRGVRLGGAGPRIATVWYRERFRPGGGVKGVTVRRPANVSPVGRNDPCPCGSGEEIQEVLHDGVADRRNSPKRTQRKFVETQIYSDSCVDSEFYLRKSALSADDPLDEDDEYHARLRAT